jgi:ferredoxin
MAVAGFLARNAFGSLLETLSHRGYKVVGPALKDGAIVYTELSSADELPAGVIVDAKPGSLRSTVTQLPRFFAWANGPQALKPLLFKAEEPLWQVQRDAGGQLQFAPMFPASQPTAVLGVRACDLAALKLLDQHFLHGEYRDPHYARRREGLMLIAVNCTHPAETCFCASTGDGPQADEGHDLLLDELDAGFIVQAGSDRGTQLLTDLTLQPVRDDQLDKAASANDRAHDMQTRSIPPGDLYEDLASRRDHPRWDDVAERCLACGNCTQVCPSCFCSREQEQPRLDGNGSLHVRQWDSCFSEGHSYIHGLVIRRQVRHRYRQWLTHKLGSWHGQYGRSGCVGCGRCIVWCPVGIDISEEVRAVLGDRHAG